MRITPPVRASHVYTQHLVAPPARVFPLLCPVREAEWAAGWAPRVVYSASGVAERDAVFVTPDEGADAIWTITEHDPSRGHVEMVKVVPALVVTRLEIDLRPDGASGCEADVRYTYTALSEAGEAYVRQRTAGWYEEFMRAWERELNAYLASRDHPVAG